MLNPNKKIPQKKKKKKEQPCEHKNIIVKKEDVEVEFQVLVKEEKA